MRPAAALRGRNPRSTEVTSPPTNADAIDLVLVLIVSALLRQRAAALVSGRADGEFTSRVSDLFASLSVTLISSR